MQRFWFPFLEHSRYYMILPLTSAESALLVKSPWIVYEVLRPGFFRPVVQLANMFANDEIEALTSDIPAA